MNILTEHGNDKSQLSVLNSTSNKLMIEAPAGYGKTKTMISKIKLLIATNKLPKHKKILGLTFSVNSTDKIKNDIDKAFKNTKYDTIKLLKIGNYHNIAMNIISKYGYLIDIKLKNLDQLKFVAEDHPEVNSLLTDTEIETLDQFNTYVTDAYDYSEFYDEQILSYNSIIIEHFISNNFITYNALITLCIELLYSNEEIRDFYKKIYPIVLIDEFQDTNILSLYLIQSLIGDDTKLFLFGDSMQRIYSFIGAIPNLIDKMILEYNMDYIKLETNYRFSGNSNLLTLNDNLRANIENLDKPNIQKNSKISLFLSDNQYLEAIRIQNIIERIDDNRNNDIVVLFRGRNSNTSIILNHLKESGVNIYDGLFNVTDKSYLRFHAYCYQYFIDYIKNEKDGKSFTRRDIKNFIQKISLEDSTHFKSYMELLEVFLEHICSSMNHNYRNQLIADTFLNNELKNYLNFIKDKIVITTIHSAKGLEWDYVILPDLESGIFPNEYFVKSKKDFLDELCIFYVAITRAKKTVFYTASKKKYGSGRGSHREFGSEPSVFFNLMGIELLINNND